jgi:hypothetical protein
MLRTTSIAIKTKTAKKYFNLYLFIFCFSLFTSSISAQTPTQKSLEAKRARLQLEIKKMNSLLFQSKAEEKNILDDISNLNRKLLFGQG